ncbi:MAG: hypothetical protein HDQ87_10070 [Clostridia bacterium]|nr:hypothetical protein [Clostridia bacterium]
MMQTNYAALKDCVLSYAGNGGIGQAEDLCLRLYVGGTVHLCCEWLTGRISAEPAEMAAVWEEALPERLHPYLCPAE